MQTTITNTTIVKAKADAKAMAEGKEVIRDGKPITREEVRDTKATGLILRIGPAGVVWQYRFQFKSKSFRLPMGAVDLLTIQEARDLAGEAQTFWKSGVGIPDEKWLQRRLIKKGKVEQPDTGHADSRHAVRWSFARARHKYLEGVKASKSAGTLADYRQKLQSMDLKALDVRPIASISRIEMAKLIAGVHASGRESTAESLVRIVGAFWSWLGEDTQTGDSGVQPGMMKGLKAPPRTRRASKRMVEDPTLEDLGRIIAVARCGAVDPQIACAIELTVWSCQRRRAIVSAHELDFRATADGSEGLWYVYADDRKRNDGEAHVIPLPPAAWECVQKAIKFKKAGKRSPYLFPAFRPRRKGGDVSHLNASTLTHTMAYLPGVDSSPHHIRSVFGTYGESVLGFLRSETKVILDHSEGGQRTDVTGRHYSLHDGTHAKWPIMRKWVSAIETDIESALAVLEPVEQIKAAIEAARYRNTDIEMLEAAE
ncbi:tyrosine-type recombinase/integrase [Devosia sp. A449]